MKLIAMLGLDLRNSRDAYLSFNFARWPWICLPQLCVYAYLVFGDPAYCFPTKTDIPLDLTTHALISFIERCLMAVCHI